MGLFFSSAVRAKPESKKMYNICIKRAESIGRADYIRSEGRADLSRIYRTDMLNFLIYLAYSDGTLQKEEVQYLNDLTGLSLDQNKISAYADRWGLKTESIKAQPPLSLEPFVRSNLGPETGELSDGYYDLVMLYVTTFNYIGSDFIACNEETRHTEIDALSSYVNMLKYYIEVFRQKMQIEKPTIAFKPGSKVTQKSPDIPQYKEDFSKSAQKVVQQEASAPAESEDVYAEEPRMSLQEMKRYRQEDKEIQEIDGRKCEPIERVVIDVPQDCMGSVMEKLGARKGEFQTMTPVGERMKLEFLIPSRGLFGYRNEFLTDTKGEGIMASIFEGYEPFKGELSRRSTGSLVAFETGESVAYGLFNAQERGQLFIGAGIPVYAGMVVGVSPKSEDISVNVCKRKQLTNTRASGSDDALRLVPHSILSLEQSLEFIKDDELVEITPNHIRLRKRILNKEERMKYESKRK